MIKTRSIAIILCTLLVTACVSSSTQPTSGAQGNSSIDKAYKNRSRDVQVGGEGVVTKLLADDNDGSRHQRFIVRLESGLTVLISPNIDLAPRVAGLDVGDRVEFYGEYVWSEKGGTVHWTHHDPRGRHVTGWIKHNYRTYQ